MYHENYVTFLINSHVGFHKEKIICPQRKSSSRNNISINYRKKIVVVLLVIVVEFHSNNGSRNDSSCNGRSCGSSNNVKLV